MCIRDRRGPRRAAGVPFRVELSAAHLEANDEADEIRADGLEDVSLYERVEQLDRRGQADPARLVKLYREVANRFAAGSPWGDDEEAAVRCRARAAFLVERHDLVV